MPSSTETVVALLHRAAERIDDGAATADHQWLADAGGQFMDETDFADENALPVQLDPRSAIGYGIMVGWIARILEEATLS